jgi:predicted acetyltransferase
MAGGLSAVATPPECRRQGLIGRLIRATLEEIRERGWPLSSLFPFYYPFYKRYGWEHMVDHYVYTIPMDRLPLPPSAAMTEASGSWHPIQRSTDMTADQESHHVDDADLGVLRSLYEDWAAHQNGPFLRNEGWWRLQKLGEGAEDPSRRPDAYYWRNAEGVPRAYVIYQLEQMQGGRSEWDRRMVVWDWVALDFQALRALLLFLRNHDSQAEEVRITVPESMRFRALFDDPDFKVETYAELMLRLVDVAAALEARSYPAEAKEEVTLAVTDPYLEWNTGIYRLTVKEGRGAVGFEPFRPATAGAPVDAQGLRPGLSLDQRALAQFYSGYLTPNEAAELGLLTVHDPAALMSAGRIFAGPRPSFTDHF